MSKKKLNKQEQDSLDWFKNLMKKAKIGEKFRSAYAEDRMRRHIKQGQMIAFKYTNPVTPLKYLKFFDASPLDIILQIKGKHMLCINLHYLTKPQRIQILSMIVKINKSNIRKGKRIQVDYGDVVHYIKSHGIEFIIKKYIIGRMQSITHIPYAEWKHAIDLDSARFVFDSQYSMADIQGHIKRSTKKTKAIKSTRNKRF